MEAIYHHLVLAQLPIFDLTIAMESMTSRMPHKHCCLLHKKTVRRHITPALCFFETYFIHIHCKYLHDKYEIVSILVFWMCVVTQLQLEKVLVLKSLYYHDQTILEKFFRTLKHFTPFKWNPDVWRNFLKNPPEGA